MEIPSEIDLLSVFECEPELLDKQKDSPFYYNKATYRFNNGRENFRVELSPSFEEFILEVQDLHSKEVITYLQFIRVESLEILEDRKEKSRILLTLREEEIMQTIQVEFKPRFQLIIKQHLDI
ncbi:hypothetical protein ACFOU2_07900 [Bacillus songklensis]|uniref:Uncharacterized protein n=1 Tax=Bacillus songklensis TaxID=1069116 RepID=A0ABV8B1E0_9BACI